jgi:adenine-specific DNA glycosylase
VARRPDRNPRRARRILKQLVAVYVRLRNQTPRCSVCPFTPQAMLNYQPTAAQQQRAELAKQPEKALVLFLQAEFNLLPDFRKHSTLHKERLKGTLKHLLKHHKPAQWQRCLENTETAIMTLGQYPLKVRYEMINMVQDYLKNLTQSTG